MPPYLDFLACYSATNDVALAKLVATLASSGGAHIESLVDVPAKLHIKNIHEY